jgi:hypothetical protein
VRFAREAPFSDDDVRIVSHHAEILARLLEIALNDRILA